MVSGRIKKRLVIGFTIVCVAMSVLFVKVGYIQVVHGTEYSKLAVEQQTKDMPISAKRGSILDRNGEELAASAVCYSVWVRPAQVKSGSTEEKRELSVNKCVDTLSEILGMDKEEVRTLVTKEQSLVKVAKYLDKETADRIREAGITGVEIAEDVKRHYPLGDFASQVLGSVTDDNNGLAGIELRYNQYLSGVSGRWIKNTDRNGNRLSYGVEKYYQAEDGLNVVLTIDEIIQHYAEKSIDTVQQATDADKVMCLVMDPKTGDILAMAITPGYDPNNPRVPLDENEAAYVESLPDDQKLEYWNQMWRNPIVSDVYEPGSTSKLLTTAMALEEGVTSLNDRFVCKHSYNVSGTILNCWRAQAHGEENLVQAVGNSCNPVFIQLAQRLGIQKFYEYLGLFGMTERSGIDYPGEAYPIIQNINTAGPVGLATMSYGQGIAVNMVQQLTAICSLGNGGKLMQPRLVKALTDSDGNVVQEFDTVEVRQVVSEKTASEMCLIMESVVSEGGGGAAKIPGYRIGGKTGTANKAAAGGYSEETYSSFVGMAPMDDPQIAILVVVDNPKGIKFGSTTAAPGAKAVLEDTLRYLQIEPQYTQEETDQINSKMSVVPDVTNTSFSTAIGMLGGASLNYIVSPAFTEEEGESDFMVVDQYPKAGEKLETGGTVFIYRE